MKPNIKYLDVAEFLLAKRREEERLANERQDAAYDTIAWIIAFWAALLAALLLVLR